MNSFKNPNFYNFGSLFFGGRLEVIHTSRFVRVSVNPRGLCPTWCHSSFSASFGRLVLLVMPRIERVLAIWCGNPGGNQQQKHGDSGGKGDVRSIFVG